MNSVPFNSLGVTMCGDEVPNLFGIFDLSTAPQLLYYAYIPIIIVSILIALFIYAGDRKSLRNQLLMAFLMFFALDILNELAVWVASYHTLLMFTWQISLIFETGLYLTAAYFAIVFVTGKDLSFQGKLALSVPALMILASIPTRLNISSYDLTNCEGVIGPVWKAMYVLGPAFILAVAVFCLPSVPLQAEPLSR